MNEHDRQALDEGDIVDIAATVQQRGMVYLWPVVAERIANTEAMRVDATGTSISYRRQHHG
jgi:hypothetical protein